MKYTVTTLLLLAGSAAVTLTPAALAGTRKPAGAPVVITPPAVHDGSNFARAPFPAARAQNDVTPPNGEAFDQNLPPNTPSTTPEPEPLPPPAVAILQPKTEPGLMPTGRPTVAASSALAPAQMDPMIRTATFETRDSVVENVRTRMRSADTTLAGFRRTESEMSAEGRTQFQSESKELKARRHALEKSLRTAEHASAADWESARAQLLADYDAYAQAVAQIDSAVGVAPAR